jgi:hypothetical protein
MVENKLADNRVNPGLLHRSKYRPKLALVTVGENPAEDIN